MKKSQDNARPHFPWEIPDPPLTEVKIKSIAREIGVKFSNRCIRDIYHFINHYQMALFVEKLKNASSPERHHELKSFHDLLVNVRGAYYGLNPFISVMDVEWRKATDRLIASVGKRVESFKSKSGRKKLYARKFLIRAFIAIFEDQTGRSFVDSEWRDVGVAPNLPDTVLT